MKPKVVLKEVCEQHTGQKKDQVLRHIVKPPAAGLDGKDKHVRHPGVDGAFLYNGFGEER